MTQEKMEELLAEAARKYSDKKAPKRPETQFKAGAMWLWKLLTEQHDIVYYEQLLRSEIENRIDAVEPWQESLIHDTAVMMVDRDEMMEEIRETGRLVTKWSKGGDPYQESNVEQGRRPLPGEQPAVCSPEGEGAKHRHAT